MTDAAAITRGNSHTFPEWGVLFPTSMDGDCSDGVQTFEQEAEALALRDDLARKLVEHRGEPQRDRVQLLKRQVFVFVTDWESAE